MSCQALLSDNLTADYLRCVFRYKHCEGFKVCPTQHRSRDVQEFPECTSEDLTAWKFYTREGDSEAGGGQEREENQTMTAHTGKTRHHLD